MRSVGSDDLRREYEEEVEWDTNPIKRAIQVLFQTTLSEANYRQVPIAEAIAEVSAAFRKEKAFEKPTHSKQATRLLNRVKKSKSTQDCVVILGAYLLQE